MKAQSSVEYLMILAVTLVIIIPVSYLFISFTSQSNDLIAYAQITEIGRSIVDNAESIYYSGEHSRLLIDVNIPEKIEEIYILSNKELIFNYTSEMGSTELIYFSDINITSDSCSGNRCDITGLEDSGLKKVKIESQGHEVLVIKS